MSQEDEFGPSVVPSEYSMFRACCFGNIEFVKRGLAAGLSSSIQHNTYSKVDWQYYDHPSEGGTIAIYAASGLGAAALASNFELVSLLLQHGCKVNGVLIDGTAEVVYAAVAGKAPMILHLVLEAGAKISPPESPIGAGFGSTRVAEYDHPFARSFSEERLECLNILLDHVDDAFLSAGLGYSGDSWLHLAAARGAALAVDTLLSSGRISPHVRNLHGRTALFASISYEEKKSIFDSMILFSDPSCIYDRSNDGETLLHALAAVVPHIDPYVSGDARVDLIQEAKEQVLGKLSSYNIPQEELLKQLWSKTANGMTPFHVAAHNDNCPFILAVAELVDAEFLPVEVDAHPYGSPLCIACDQSKLYTAAVLLELGSCPNHTHTGSARSMPLWLALESEPGGLFAYKQKESKYTEFVVQLADYGVDLAAQDEEGNTILHIMCAEKRDMAAAHLVRAGASLLTPNNDGRTPLQHMQACSRPDRAWGLPSHAELIALLASEEIPQECSWQRRRHAVEAWQDCQL